ncbi:hypothetical protein MMC20_004337 [Loxospora ochrophaea]|nr:hypothetical protein [Loxospora ochrophaea]
MLEGQQRQLVAGLQTLYSRTVNRQGWIGEPLAPVGGDKVSIHQILERLDTELDFDTMLPEGTLDDSRRDPGTPRLISRSQSGSPSSQARQLSPDIAAALFPPGTTFHDPDLERRHLIQHRHDTDNDNNAAAIEPLSLPARLLQSLELPPHPLIPPFNLDYSPLESLSQPTLPQRRLEQALQAGIDPAELLLSVHP